MAGSYEVPEFVNNDEFCPLTYTMTIEPHPSWITKLSEREIQYETQSNDDQGVYLIEVMAVGI